eukprot:scaffold209635_cov39-Prasinocladus_malaysianus.AAC.1
MAKMPATALIPGEEYVQKEAAQQEATTAPDLSAETHNDDVGDSRQAAEASADITTSTAALSPLTHVPEHATTDDAFLEKHHPQPFVADLPISTATPAEPADQNFAHPQASETPAPETPAADGGPDEVYTSTETPNQPPSEEQQPTSTDQPSPQQDDDPSSGASGRRKRKIRPPKRFDDDIDEKDGDTSNGVKVRRLLSHADVTGSLAKRQVHLYWPDDCLWYAATIKKATMSNEGTPQPE